MTLTVQNQLTLLHDLLDEQLTDSSASIAEYQQIKRLVESMIQKGAITDEELLQLLPDIYNYGREGENAQSLSEHIEINKENIYNWKHIIEQNHL